MHENRKIVELYYIINNSTKLYWHDCHMFLPIQWLKLGVYSQLGPIVSCPKQAQTMKLYIMSRISTIFRSQNISMKTVAMTISALM